MQGSCVPHLKAVANFLFAVGGGIRGIVDIVNLSIRDDLEEVVE